MVSSPAGDVIPNIHVRLLKRVVVKERKGRKVGMTMSMDWPGYSGWEATPIFQEEIDALWKNWNIPLRNVEEDITFVYDAHIVKKPRNPKPDVPAESKKTSRRKRRIVRPAKEKK